MYTTRRTFLRTLGAATAFVAGGGISAISGQKRSSPDLFDVPPEAYSEPLFSATAKEFDGLIGRTFTAKAANGSSLTLVLTEVNQLERMGNTTRGYYGESFSLILESKGKRVFGQDVYEVSGGGLEPFTALIVPTGLSQKKYEIIVNHLTR